MITLNLKPEIEAKLIAEAESKGISVEQYLEKFIEEQLTNQQSQSSSSTISIQEWEEQLLDFVNTPINTGAMPLSDEAISRESIYTREDKML